VASWEAEIVVDEALAVRLVTEQFPELAGEPVEALGSGWDYTAYRVGTEWAFRFPRREIVLDGMARELAALPVLEARLPHAVPAPRFVGTATDDFPWPFVGAPFIYGHEPLGLDDEGREALARPLAEFLRELHRPETLAAAGPSLADDPIGRGDMARRVPMARERLAGLGLELPDDVAQAEDLPPAQPTALCHGDLHVRQLLVAGGALSGVIDWIDVMRADPGVDLSLLWSFFPAPAREEFLDAYGPVPEASLLRARVLALMLNATLVHYARALGLDALEREAYAGVLRALSP
jgi:aminoglycoside phosphotransferase (APT) family kinase protein